MAKKRLSMTKITEILRLRIGEKRSLREVARSVKCSPSTVHDIIEKATELGIGWPVDDGIDEATLESIFYEKQSKTFPTKTVPDMKYIDQQLKMKGVTLALLWLEYKESNCDEGYQYSRFCELFRSYQKKLSPELRQTHKAGDKAFVDWSGDGITITDRESGQTWEAPLFVGTLGASGYSYITAKSNRKLRNWIRCHCEMYEYFGGVPQVTVPDNEKTGVTRACLYEPDLNRTYHQMALHYDTTVLPTRPYEPKDKALVENAVLLAQRWILASLRNHVFFTLEQANAAIAEKLEEYNGRKMQLVDATRRELFEQIDKPELQPLPKGRYEFSEWSETKVQNDYHVRIDKHFYSVPFQLVGEQVSAARTSSMVSIYYKSKRVALHKRLYESKNPSTLVAHMPPHHREFHEWTPDRFLTRASAIGDATRRLIVERLDAVKSPEHAYRSCLGVLKLAKKYGDNRLEAACKRATFINAKSYKSLCSILENRLDTQSLPSLDLSEQSLMPSHENIRGPEDYN